MRTASRNTSTATVLPPDFIPADYPVLSQHWFGVEPQPSWESTAAVVTRVVERLACESVEIEDRAA